MVFSECGVEATNLIQLSRSLDRIWYVLLGTTDVLGMGIQFMESTG